MPVGGASSGASSGAVRAGGAYVEAFLNDNKLVRGLEAVKRRMQAFGAFTTSIGKKLSIAGGAITAPLAASLWKEVDAIKSVGDLQEKFGGTVESMSRLAYAFKTTGVEADEVDGLMKKLAITASKEADDPKGGMLGRLGIDAQEFLKLDPEKKLQSIAAALADIPEEEDKLRVLTELMGKSGDRAFKLLANGVDEYSGRLQLADDNGQVFSKEQAGQAKVIARSFKEMKASVTAAGLAIGGALLPLADIIGQYFKVIKAGWVEVRKWIDQNKELFQVVAGVGVGLVVAGGAFTFIGKAVGLFGSLVGGLLLPLQLVFSALTLLLSPLGLIAAALGGLGFLFVTQTEAGKRFGESVSNDWQNIKSNALNAWGGIVAAIKKGDMELAAQIAFAAIKLAWADMVLSLTEKWVWFKKHFRDGWADLGTGIRLIWNDLTSALAKGLAWVLDKALWLFRNTVGLLFDGLAWAAKKLGADDAAKTLAEIGGLRFDSPEVQGEIEADRVRERNRILTEAAKAQAERDKFRAEQIGNAKKDVTDAQNELNNLVNKAKEGAAGPGAKPAGSDSLERLRRIQPLAEAAKGLFQSPDWKQSLGIGDKIAERQLKVANKQLVAQQAAVRLLQTVQVLKVG